MNQKKSTKKLVIATIIFIAVIAIMAIVYMAFKPKGTEGAKKIVAEVVLSDGSSEEFTIQTDAKFLRQALEEKDLIHGSESEFGLFITEVNGVTVDDANQEWWCITLAGGTLNTGVDTTPIKDGDHFEITLTVGY